MGVSCGILNDMDKYKMQNKKKFVLKIGGDPIIIGYPDAVSRTEGVGPEELMKAISKATAEGTIPSHEYYEQLSDN